MHTTEVIHFSKLSNGQFCAVIRCCGNASTDWSHTMAAEVVADDIKRGSSIGIARQQCADLHEAAIKAESALINEVSAPPVEHP